FDSIKDIKKELKGFNLVKSFDSKHKGLIVVVFKKK
ncbi:hypothetical protein LCGC14_2788230, partial [marine sediment metagenome]